jgi:hypothetical protein
MRKYVFITVACLALAACSAEVKPLENSTATQNPIVDMGKQESLGTFSGSSAHPSTAGTVKVITDSKDATKKVLSFENFKVDAGPDLRIYLAEDTRATGFTEVSLLKNTGTFAVEIPASANLSKQKFVLIWCKQFSVLFGSAQLQ